MKTKMLLIVIVLVACAAFSAWSEEPYTFLKTGVQGGLNLAPVFSQTTELLGSVYSLGVQVHVIPMLSVRPSMWLCKYDQQRDDSLNGYDVKYNETMIVGGRIDLLWHAIRSPNGSFYLGPSGGGYGWTNTNYYTPPNSGKSDTTSRNGFLIGAVAGGQYLFGKGFGAFVDARFTYSNYSSHYQAWNTSGATTSDYTYRYDRFFFEGATIGFIAYLN